jgi:hypothetical protein
MAAVSQFAGDSLLHQGGGFEPQRKSNFALVINGIGDSADSLVLSVDNSNVPSIQIVDGKIKYFNETMKYAGSVAPFEDQTIQYRDFIDQNTFQLLSAWMQQVINFQTGAIGFAKDYKKTGDILLLPPSTPNPQAPGAVQDSPYNNRMWNLVGIWPKQLKHDNVDAKDDGSSPMLITLVLSIDRAIPGFMLQ